MDRKMLMNNSSYYHSKSKYLLDIFRKLVEIDLPLKLI